MYFVFTRILIFVSGVYFLVKNYKDGKYSKVYGLLSNISTWGIAMCTSIIVGNLLLKLIFSKNNWVIKNTFNRLLSTFNLDDFVVSNKTSVLVYSL